SHLSCCVLAHASRQVRSWLICNVSQMKPLFTDLFYHDGRGPELVRIHWKARGEILKAIDFMPPDASSSEDICHLLFDKLQVVQIIPEEVIDYRDFNDALIAHRP